MPSPHDPGRSRLQARLADRLAAGALDLPLFPETASRVLSTCEDPDCDAQRLGGLLESDPTLAGNVLRVANSAAYAPAEPILTLPQAVSRLGFGAVCSIATALALQGEVFAVDGHEQRLARMWKHATLTGTWCKELARARRRNAEGAFLCGLLHDVGQPVLLQLFARVAREEGMVLEDELLEELVHDGHGSLGERLLREWGLPEWTAQAARHHHDPGGATACLEEVHTVGLADALAHWTLAPDGEHEGAVRGHASLARLGLYPDELGALLERRERVVEAAEAFQ